MLCSGGVLLRSAIASVLLYTAACGGGSADPDAPPSADAAPGDYRADRIGFVTLVQGDLPSEFAQIMDGPELPTPILATTVGECAIFVRPAPASCPQGCTTGVCTAPGVCTPYPAPASAGTLTVDGLRQPLQFTTGAFGYTPDWIPSDGVLFDPGASITVSAPGDVTPAFSASLAATPTLSAPFHNLTLVDHEDAPITWTAASAGTIQISLVVGWHGSPPEAVMNCETADDGSFSIPGDAIAALPRASSGLEQHTSFLARISRAVIAAPAGPIELVAGSAAPLYFSHP